MGLGDISESPDTENDPTPRLRHERPIKLENPANLTDRSFCGTPVSPQHSFQDSFSKSETFIERFTKNTSNPKTPFSALADA